MGPWLVTLVIGFGLGFLCAAVLLVWLSTGPVDQLPPDAEAVQWRRRLFDQDQGDAA